MGTLHIPPRPAGQARNMSGGSSLPFQNTSARNNCKEKKFLDCFLAQAHISGQLLGLIRVGERNRGQSQSQPGVSASSPRQRSRPWGDTDPVRPKSPVLT